MTEQAPDDDELQTQLAAAQRQIEELEATLASARLIGMAVGIIMAQRKLPREQAFELLRQAGREGRVTVRELADAVVRDGGWPEADPVTGADAPSD